MDVVKVMEGTFEKSTDALALNILTFGSVVGATGTDPKLKGAKLMLFVGNVAFEHDTLLADLTACDFDGYALSAAITWALPSFDEVGNRVLLGDQKTFTCTGEVAVNNVAGAAIVDGAGTGLLVGAMFDAPIITVNGLVLRVTPTYRLDPEA